MRISDWSSDVCSSDLLPGQGWPLGSLIELLTSQPGIGEIRLLQPALASLGSERSVALVRPPYEPYFHSWVDWRLQTRRLLWINPQTPGDALWAAEQILTHNACAALFCWAEPRSEEPQSELQSLMR